MKFILLALFAISLFLLTLPLVFSAVVEITIEYAPGPSLTAEIVDYPSCANALQSIAVKAKVTNAGSENATNVWLALNLPSGWSSTATLNKTIGTLQPNQIGWNNVTYTTGTRGSYTITAKANCSEGAGSTDSKTITVYSCGDGICDSPCESTTTCLSDCPAAPGAPGGPGGPAIVTAWSFVVDSYIEVFENQSAIKNVLVKNEGNVDLHDLKINVTDLASDWYKIEPSEYPRAIPGETKSFIITYTPRAKGTYSFKINIISSELSNTTSVTLLVKELTPEEKKIIEELPKIVEEISKKLEIIKPALIITGMIAPAIIAAYMLVTIMIKRCPVCGSRLILGYRGKFVVSYKCSKCEYFEIKEAGK